jgi:predicted dehydrogenase
VGDIMNIAVIGVGYWGPNYVRSINQLKGMSVSWVCDLDKNKLSKIKDVFPQTKITTEINDILKTHYDVAKECLKNGKHVLVEKPLTTSSSECIELIKIAKQKERILMVGHIFDYNQAICKIREYIEKKELGEIIYTSSLRTGLGPIRNDVNAMWDLASHDVYILLNLLKENPKSVVVSGKSHIKEGIEDVVFMTLEFGKNIFSSIHVSWLDPIKIRNMTLVGTKKMVVFDDISVIEKIKVFDKGVSYEKPLGSYGEFQLSIRDGDILIPKVNVGEPLIEEIKHFMDCITNNKKPLSDGIEGYKVVKILEAAQESLKNNSKKVNIEFENDL